jgi:hypothetical protein
MSTQTHPSGAAPIGTTEGVTENEMARATIQMPERIQKEYVALGRRIRDDMDMLNSPPNPVLMLALIRIGCKYYGELLTEIKEPSK